MRALLIGAIAVILIGAAGSAEDAREMRLPPPYAFDFTKAEGAGAGTSGVTGIQTIVLKGDPTKPLYAILLRVPAHTKIAAHHHAVDRIATVVSGTWYFGCGDKFNESSLRPLPPGSFYTEPPNDNHFTETRDSDVLVQISGLGPTGTTYVDATDNS